MSRVFVCQSLTDHRSRVLATREMADRWMLAQHRSAVDCNMEPSGVKTDSDGDVGFYVTSVSRMIYCWYRETEVEGS